MSAQPCRAEDIININHQKEYTLIATDLLESVLTDTQLNAQTVKLWQILFNKARYNAKLEIKISYLFLGNKMGKSTRTIARYVDCLQKSGYLIVKHNFDNNGGQRPSTLSVRVPTSLIDHAKKRKDKTKKNTLCNNKIFISKTINDKVDVYNATEVSVSAAIDSSKVLCETLKNRFIKESPEHHNQSAPHQEESNKNDNNGRGGDDRSVLQKNNNKKDINNNNIPSVVIISEDNEQTTKRIALQEEVTLLENQIAEKNRHIANIQNHDLRYDKIRECAALEGMLNIQQIALERLNREWIEKTKHNTVAIKLDNDANLIQNKMGERPLSQLTFKRLVKFLKAYGYHGSELNCLINEIVFEVRFGSLIRCNKTQKHLDIDNAINIALKLVRENRWSTPVLLKKFALNNFH